MNDKFGMGLPDLPSNITTSLPLFMVVDLPYSIQRNEILLIDIPFFNRVKQKQNVVITIAKTGKFLGVDLATYGWSGTLNFN